MLRILFIVKIVVVEIKYLYFLLSFDRYIYIYIHIHIYIYLCVYVYAYVCMKLPSILLFRLFCFRSLLRSFYSGLPAPYIVFPHN